MRHTFRIAQHNPFHMKFNKNIQDCQQHQWNHMVKLIQKIHVFLIFFINKAKIMTCSITMFLWWHYQHLTLFLVSNFLVLTISHSHTLFGRKGGFYQQSISIRTGATNKVYFSALECCVNHFLIMLVFVHINHSPRLLQISSMNLIITALQCQLLYCTLRGQ